MATSTHRIPVTLVPGDGIGREVTEAARRIVEATDAPIDWEETEAGAEVFKKGLPSGVPEETIGPSPYPRDVERAARDPRGLRREERERHAPEAVRDLRERPAGP